MMMKKREEGHYHLRAGDTWFIGYWDTNRELWYFHDTDWGYSDNQWSEIDERRITRDGQERLVSLIKQARQEWLDHNDTKDGTDVVTPYDEVLYR